MKISVIIVNYKTSKYLQYCIDSINIYEKDCEKEFIVVDNKSDDGSEEIINSIVSGSNNVKKVMLDSNYGFAYANNRGFEVSDGEYILILNPDVLFTESTFTKLVNYSNDSSVGGLGVKLYGEDGCFQSKYYQKHPSLIQYVLFYSVLSKPFIGKDKYERRHLMADIEESCKELQSIPQIPGAFIFMRRAVYEEFKGFNESFFLFFEDVDLSYRISKKYKLFVADIKVKHTGASSMMMDTNYKIYGYYVLSMLNFFRNNYSYLSSITLKTVIFINTVLKISIEGFRKMLKTDKPGIIKVHKYILNNLFQ